MSTVNEVTTSQVAERAAAVKKRPKESDFIGKKGYERVYPDPERPNYYQWRYQMKPNDGHGKLTKEGHESVEMLKPSIEADTERNHKLQARVSRAALTDSEGCTQYVNAERADDVAKANGWHHRWRPRGCEVERGWCETGQAMLWRWVGEWMPTGKSCLGTPLSGRSRVSTRGLQYDPAGEPWRFLDGEWRKL